MEHRSEQFATACRLQMRRRIHRNPGSDESCSVRCGIDATRTARGVVQRSPTVHVAIRRIAAAREESALPFHDVLRRGLEERPRHGRSSTR